MVTVTNSSISGNVSDNQAAGIGNWNDSVMTLSNSTVPGNTAESSGGGIINENSAALTITNSTISGNEAEEAGGGIFVNADEPTITLTNVTMAGNVADRDGSDDGDGGGISIQAGYTGAFTLKNTLIGDNTDATSAGGTPHHDCSAPGGPRHFAGPQPDRGHHGLLDHRHDHREHHRDGPEARPARRQRRADVHPCPPGGLPGDRRRRTGLPAR